MLMKKISEANRKKSWRLSFTAKSIILHFHGNIHSPSPFTSLFLSRRLLTGCERQKRRQVRVTHTVQFHGTETHEHRSMTHLSSSVLLKISVQRLFFPTCRQSESQTETLSTSLHGKRQHCITALLPYKKWHRGNKMHSLKPCV